MPYELFLTAKAIVCYIYLHDEVTDGRTVYTIKIPVKDRPKPSDVEPTPVQQDIITQAIAALNNAVDTVTVLSDETEENALAAEHYADLASQCAGTAGYLEIEIDERGHLIYTKTDAVDVDFRLQNGHLIMEGI